MLGDFSKLHSLRRIVLVGRNQLFLIVVTVVVLAITSGTAYYLATTSKDSHKDDPKSELTSTPGHTSSESNLDGTSDGSEGEVAGTQTNEAKKVSGPTPTLTPGVTPITQQTPNSPQILPQTTVLNPSSYQTPYSTPTTSTDPYIEHLHQLQEENARRQEYCNQVRDQRSAAVAPYGAKRTEILNQYNDAIAKYVPGQLDSLWKQHLEADAEYWKVYNSFDTSCV